MTRFLAAIDSGLSEEMLIEQINDAHTKATLVVNLDDHMRQGQMTPELNALREILNEIYHRSS